MSKKKKSKKTKIIHTVKQQNYFKHFSGIKTIFTLLFVVTLMFFLPKDCFKTYENIETEIIEIVEEVEEEVIIPKHVSFEVIDDGYNIYAPSSSKKGYRYGPSIIYYDDGSMDAWFSSNANNNEWDWITYRHFDGNEWSKEKIVLQPTGNSYDRNSCCDPGVIYFNDYYYLAYTSSLVETNGGINNNVFVARSKNPDGPYEKWNGNGWGKEPYPIIYYDESDAFWGAGEPSFVIKGDTLYIYYSWLCADGNFTKVATANLSDNWPLSIKEQGFALTRIYGQDSIDVAYIEEIDKFIAFSAYSRFTNQSGILISESDDGIDFHKSDYIATNLSTFLHNVGISKRKDGHICLNDNLLVGYAYGVSSSTWGNWASRFQGINLIVYEGERFKEFDEEKASINRTLKDNSIDENIYLMGINVDNRTIRCNVGSACQINLYSYNNLLNKQAINKDITIDYDEEMLKINGLCITPLQVGESEIVIHYDDYYTTCKVIAYEKGTKKNSNSNIVKFEPVQKNIVSKLSDDSLFVKQIRAYVEFENGNWGEGYNDYTRDHWKYPAMVDAGTYHMNFYYDESVIDVSDEGLIYPKKLGETDVKVTMNDELEFTVHVSVK